MKKNFFKSLKNIYKKFLKKGGGKMEKTESLYTGYVLGPITVQIAHVQDRKKASKACRDVIS